MKNTQIRVGMIWNRDWHEFKVESISKDGKTCIISETWVSEDDGHLIHKIYRYNISEDQHGQFVWQNEYKKYAFDDTDEDGYRWWARMYACGADNNEYSLED